MHSLGLGDAFKRKFPDPTPEREARFGHRFPGIARSLIQSIHSFTHVQCRRCHVIGSSLLTRPESCIGPTRAADAHHRVWQVKIVWRKVRRYKITDTPLRLSLRKDQYSKSTFSDEFLKPWRPFWPTSLSHCLLSKCIVYRRLEMSDVKQPCLRS